MIEELEQKASELNLQNVSLSGIVRNHIADILVEFANEATKELQEENEKLKKENADVQQSCENYYNEMRAYKTQIKELQQKIDSLQGYLDHDIEYDIEQKNKELKAQIEKMKCCCNCKSGDVHTDPFKKKCNNCHLMQKWELKE